MIVAGMFWSSDEPLLDAQSGGRYYMCIGRGIVMRTNIVIDDEIMRAAMEVTGVRTKKGVVEKALREMIERGGRKNLADLRGKIRFEDGYDYKALREGKR